MLKKIKQIFRDLWIGLILGMKKTEDENFHQNGGSLDEGSTINQQVSDHSVAKALLRGELTQEVIDLRYRTYAVARESEHYNYFSPTLATKKKPSDSKFVYVENEDNRDIVTIQENKLAVENVTEALSRIGEDGTPLTIPAFHYDFLGKILKSESRKVMTRHCNISRTDRLHQQCCLQLGRKLCLWRRRVNQRRRWQTHQFRGQLLQGRTGNQIGRTRLSSEVSNHPSAA